MKLGQDLNLNLSVTAFCNCHFRFSRTLPSSSPFESQWADYGYEAIPKRKGKLIIGFSELVLVVLLLVVLLLVALLVVLLLAIAGNISARSLLLVGCLLDWW